MKGHVLIKAGKWERHEFFRRKNSKISRPDPPIKNIPSLMYVICYIIFVSNALIKDVIFVTKAEVILRNNNILKK